MRRRSLPLYVLGLEPQPQSVEHRLTTEQRGARRAASGSKTGRSREVGWRLLGTFRTYSRNYSCRRAERAAGAGKTSTDGLGPPRVAPLPAGRAAARAGGDDAAVVVETMPRLRARALLALPGAHRPAPAPAPCAAPQRYLFDDNLCATYISDSPRASGGGRRALCGDGRCAERRGTVIAIILIGMGSR